MTSHSPYYWTILNTFLSSMLISGYSKIGFTKRDVIVLLPLLITSFMRSLKSKISLREKYPDTQFFWSVFSCIRTRKTPYLNTFHAMSESKIGAKYHRADTAVLWNYNKNNKKLLVSDIFYHVYVKNIILELARQGWSLIISSIFKLAGLLDSRRYIG